jgi:hypothetical protein
MNESAQFREGLLLALLWEDDDEWLDLTTAMERATGISGARHGTRELAYPTQRNVRRALMKEGLIDQDRVGTHFTIALSAAGITAAQAIPEDPAESAGDARLPDAPFRLDGQNHRLPVKLWQQLVRRVNLGELDLMVIPRDQHTKTGYWDE